MRFVSSISRQNGVRLKLLIKVVAVVSYGVTSAIFEGRSFRVHSNFSIITSGSKLIFNGSYYRLSFPSVVRGFLGNETIEIHATMAVVSVRLTVPRAITYNVLRGRHLLDTSTRTFTI